MPRTPQRTLRQSFIVTSGDIVTGEGGSGITLQGGAANPSGGTGAPIALLAGAGTSSGNGGSISLTSGDATVGASGNINLTPGTNAGATLGLTSITRGALQLAQHSSVPGVPMEAGQGRLWVRNDSLTSLVFTDSVGADTSLGLHAPERGYYSVLQYGATTDPLVDSRQAFQDANDACQAAGGGVVVVPAVLDTVTQAFLIDGTVTIGPNVTVAGLGPRSIVFGRPAAGNATFQFAAGANRGGLRDLQVLGNSAVPRGIGVSFTGSQFNTVERVQVWDFEIGVDVSDGVTPFSAYNVLQEVEINRSAVIGLRAHQNANGFAVIGGRIFYTFDGANGGVAVSLENARAVSINGLSIEAYDVGLHIAGATSGSICGTWMEKGANDPPGTARVDFVITDTFSESPFFEGNIQFQGNHYTDVWPLRATLFNVRDYGALADGNPDADGIQDAANAARDAGGGIVFLPSGTYNVATTITYATNVSFQGAGTQATLINYSGTGYCFAQSLPGTRIFNNRFTDLQVTFTNAATGGIHLNDVSLAHLEDVAVFGPGIGTGFGIHVSGSTNGFAVYNRFDHVRALSCNYGYNIDAAGSNDTHFNDCRATACARGISVTNSNHVVVTSSAIETCTIGIYVESLTTSLSDGLTITANRFENNTSSNIEVGGSPSFVRHLNIKGNHHVTGTPYVNVMSTTLPNVAGDTGTAAGIFYIVSAQADTPFHFERTASGASNLPGFMVRDSNIGSGTPNTLHISCGRLTGHALSINEWSGTADTERFYITGAGDIVSGAGATFATNLVFTGASSTITLGDGIVDGNAQVLFQKTSLGNKTVLQFRNGTTSSGTRQAIQFNSSSDLTGLTFDGSGALHGIHPWTSRYSSVSGRAGWAVSRFWADLNTTVVAGDFTPVNWGSDVVVTVGTNSKELRGQVTVTVGATAVGSNPSLTLTFPDGTWGVIPPFAIVARNGGTGTNLSGYTWSTTGTTLVLSAVGTPLPGETYIYNWMMMG